MAEPFIAEIKMFGGNFAPRGYAFCNGQLLAIAQNQALFSLLGTTFGGNGQTNFALPNMQSRVPVHWGQGPGLPNRTLGEQSGEENHTVINSEMPAHNHLVNAINAPATAVTPGTNLLAVSSKPYLSTNAANTTLSPTMVSANGGNQSHNNMQPYLAVTFIIALVGIFPSRN
jgi:microcystin-dependent protein